jgi:hypothetical protein
LCTNLSQTTIVEVVPFPTALAPGNNGPACEGASLDLFAATIAGAIYNWTGPNGFTSTLQNPTVAAIANAAMSGNYEVTASVNGCTSAIETTTVIVNATPSGLAPGSNGPICEGTTLNLSLTTIAGATYNWTGPDGFTSTLQNPTVAANANAFMTGNYEVTATLNGCTSIVETTNVSVNPIPLAPTVSYNGPVDEGDTLALSASTVVGATYSWTGPDGFTSTLQNPTVSNATTLNMAGTYAVTVTVNGCASNAENILVIVNTTVGGNNMLNKNNISIYPNPTSEQLAIKYDGIQSMKIEIFNNIGACVFQGYLNNGTNVFDITSFAEGVYAIRIIGLGDMYMQKLVKN